MSLFMLRPHLERGERIENISTTDSLKGVEIRDKWERSWAQSMTSVFVSF